MAVVLPSTVEEINELHQNFGFSSSTKDVLFNKGPILNKGFENIPVEKRNFRREVSLPNDVENWNIGSYDSYLGAGSYLNFEDNLAVVSDTKAGDEDRLVPGDGVASSRSDSFSSSMEDKRMLFQGYGVKTFNTICMDSGSTCISNDHSYIGHTQDSDSIFRGLDAEETYQNLDLFLQQVPEMTVTENLPSPLSSSDSNFDFPGLQTGGFPMQSTSQEGTSRGIKRPASTSSEEDLFAFRDIKQLCQSPPAPVQYATDVRRKNNIASKNCRKTRKEKQKEMETRVSELEKEKEGLRVEVQVLEELIQAHKMQLYAILQKR